MENNKKTGWRFLSKKVASVFTAALTTLGITESKASTILTNSDMPEIEPKVAQVEYTVTPTNKPRLILKANPKNPSMGKAVFHNSHRSHASHASHRSHFSHYSRVS